MKGIINLLSFINENWTSITVIIGLILLLYVKLKKYLNLSREEKIKSALILVKNELPKLMSDAEIEWSGYKKSGEIKKSEVLGKIFEKYPELYDVINQDKIIDMIDKMIDEVKPTIDRIITSELEDLQEVKEGEE